MFDGRNLVDELEDHHLSWKAYMQAIPATGSTVEYARVVDGVSVPRKLYAQKHDPFMYFSDIRNDPRRMEKIVGFDGFAKDLEQDRVPNFVWISPDQCHDMHGSRPPTRGRRAAQLRLPRLQPGPRPHSPGRRVREGHRRQDYALAGLASALGYRARVGRG